MWLQSLWIIEEKKKNHTISLLSYVPALKLNIWAHWVSSVKSTLPHFVYAFMWWKKKKNNLQSSQWYKTTDKIYRTKNHKLYLVQFTFSQKFTRCIYSEFEANKAIVNNSSMKNGMLDDDISIGNVKENRCDTRKKSWFNKD